MWIVPFSSFLISATSDEGVADWKFSFLIMYSLWLIWEISCHWLLGGGVSCGVLSKWLAGKLRAAEITASPFLFEHTDKMIWVMALVHLFKTSQKLWSTYSVAAPGRFLFSSSWVIKIQGAIETGLWKMLPEAHCQLMCPIASSCPTWTSLLDVFL